MPVFSGENGPTSPAHVDVEPDVVFVTDVSDVSERVVRPHHCGATGAVYHNRLDTL